MSNNSNKWANLGTNLKAKLSNLKTLFAMPKWLKIFLSVVSVIFVALIIATIALNALTKDKIYNANLTLKSQNALENGDKISYHIWIDAKEFKPLLRSRSISSVDMVNLAWNSAINQNALDNLRISGIRIWVESTQDLGALGLESLGFVKYKVDFYPLMRSLVRYFVNILVCVIAFWAMWRVFIDLMRSLPPKNIAPDSTRALLINRKDCAFLGFAFALCAGICGFTFWLGFPGYHIIGDTYNSIATIKNNAHPVFIAYVMEILYALFGKNLYYLFLFNIVPFYLGIFFLIAGFYLRFRSIFALLLLFPTFIGNIYFQNFVQYHSFALPMMLFCLYSLLLFLILVPLNWQSKRQKILAKSLWSLLFVLMFFAILWRHNAIFSVFPAFLIIAYLFLRNRNLDSRIFARVYAKLVALSAVLCLAVVIVIPKALQTQTSNPANHPFLHQIAGACVPANDSSCFKQEWYYPHKSWEDVVALYAKYPLNADPFNVSWGFDEERPFKPEKLQGLQTRWIKAIIKYPRNFLAHEARFFKAMWWQEPKWIFDAQKMQTKATHKWHIAVTQGFKESQRSIVFTPLQERIYTALFNHKIVLNHIWGVGAGFVILVLSSALLWKRRGDIFAKSALDFANQHNGLDSASEAQKTQSDSKNKPQIAQSSDSETQAQITKLDSVNYAQRTESNALLVFCFSVSFASFFSAVFIAAFSPVPEPRYMSPILPMSIVAFVGFIAFVIDYLAQKRCESKK